MNTVEISPINDKRLKVQLPGDNHLLSDTAREIGKILANTNLFSRAGHVFTVNEHGDGLSLMTPEMLRTWIESYLVCYRVKKVEGANSVVEFKRTISQSDANGVLNSPQFIKQLKQIEKLNPVRMPIRRKDGYIELLPEGYDEETRTFTINSVPIVQGMPVAEAKQVIDDLLAEFSFADSGRSKAVAIGAMLTVFGTGLLPHKSLRPCFIVLANAEGAGKTLLVKCATVPVLGYAPTSTKPKDEDEMKKSLLAAVMEARPVIFFDNLKRHLSSEALEGFITSQNYEGRILGQTKSFRGGNHAVVFITGNGCTVSPDMRRRSLFCELHLEVERAEDRVFQNNLEVPVLEERRSVILSALWSSILAWHKAMEPKPSRSNSSFSDWAQTIGGIVEFAGWGCPLETPQIEAAADVDGQDMRSLVSALANGSIHKLVRFDEIVQIARDNGLFERLLPAEGELDPTAKSSFGQLLRSYNGRLVADWRFFVEGKGHSKRFKIERINPTNG